MNRRPPRLPRLAGPKPADVTAGLVTGLFSIPEGMAYAAIAGFNPVAGLFSGVVPAIVGSLTARTVLMVTTLTSAISLTAQSVLADAGLDPASSGNIAMLTVMTGLVMLLMGVLRLGVVLSFVSNAVMTGFSVGIAVQIITGVLKDATGYKPHGHNKLAQLADWLAHAASWQLAATLTAAATIAVWALAHTVERLRTVALLVAMVAVSAAVAVLGTDVELVKGIADIPSALPHLTAPDWSAFPHLLGGALSIALVALAQAARQGRLLALQPAGDGHWTTAAPPARLTPGQVTVLDYNGVSLFAELPRIERDWPAPAPDAVLILVVRNLPDVPSSAMIKLLRRKADELHQTGGRLILAGVQPPLAKIATDTGLADHLGPGGIAPATGVLFGPLESALRDVDSWLTTRPGSRPRPRSETGEQGPTPQP
ncbi:SulP family inorganic anion transporter [Kitasatospora sp. NPDC058263]